MPTPSVELIETVSHHLRPFSRNLAFLSDWSVPRTSIRSLIAVLGFVRIIALTSTNEESRWSRKEQNRKPPDLVLWVVAFRVAPALTCALGVNILDSQQ